MSEKLMFTVADYLVDFMLIIHISCFFQLCIQSLQQTRAEKLPFAVFWVKMLSYVEYFESVAQQSLLHLLHNFTFVLLCPESWHRTCW